MAYKKTDYEKMLTFNSVLSWVHSLRYRETVKILKRSFGKKRITVWEVGCAHAQLFETLSAYFEIDYYAIERDANFCQEAFNRYGSHPNFHIINGSGADPVCYKNFPDPDVIVSLETFEHMPNQEVLKTLDIIAKSTPTLFLCSVPVEIGPAVLFKNLASFFFRYHRHRAYSWKETLWAAAYRLDKLPPHACQHKGFDWRILLSQIKEKMPVVCAKTLPFNILPAAISNSIFMVATQSSSDSR
ncbi:MAG: class I SAM-dependent methyltransferase [Gammaproteobacteria bacterium]|nr:class I SAM-dependent methyltransferase [Gammaproteobacteria bacterium]